MTPPLSRRRQQQQHQQQSSTTTRTTFLLTSLLLFFLSLSCFPTLAFSRVKFVDVTPGSGLTQPFGAALKYGGPCVADLNGDGLQDLILLHHDDAPAEMYFNLGNMKFKRVSNWEIYGDVHGVTAFHYSPQRKGMHVIVMKGGANGLKPQPPLVYQVSSNGGQKVSSLPKLPIEAGARGRAAIAISLRKGVTLPRPDVLLSSAHLFDSDRHQRALKLEINNRMILTPLIGDYVTARNEFVTVTDINGDGIMEVLGFQALKAYEVSRNFLLKDITNDVFPYKGFTLFGVNAIAELDFNNDGQWDLYLARTNGQNIHWLPSSYPSYDILLENVNGTYKDTSAMIRNSLSGFSRGVTVGDFDNDGFIDILVTRYIADDVILWNKGDGTFQKPVNAGIGRLKSIPGDQAVAVDLDEDGLLDLVVSEGTWYLTVSNKSWGGRGARGKYKILKNIGNKDNNNNNNYLLVQVGNSPGLKTTSLHAAVYLRFYGQKDKDTIMSRRVGSPGTAVSVSNIETVHFGLGKRQRVKEVEVRWTDGQNFKMNNVAVNQKIFIGETL